MSDVQRFGPAKLISRNAQKSIFGVFRRSRYRQIYWVNSFHCFLVSFQLMSRSLNSLSKFARPQNEIGCPSSFVPSKLLSRNINLRYTRTGVRPGPLLVVPTACVPLRSGFGNVRHYANYGMPQNFPGLNGLGQQQQKGDALKEYVHDFLRLFLPRN